MNVYMSFVTNIYIFKIPQKMILVTSSLVYMNKFTAAFLNTSRLTNYMIKMYKHN